MCNALRRSVIFWEEIQDTLCTTLITCAESARQLAIGYGLRVKRESTSSRYVQHKNWRGIRIAETSVGSHLNVESCRMSSGFAHCKDQNHCRNYQHKSESQVFAGPMHGFTLYIIGHQTGREGSLRGVLKWTISRVTGQVDFADRYCPLVQSSIYVTSNILLPLPTNIRQ